VIVRVLFHYVRWLLVAVITGLLLIGQAGRAMAWFLLARLVGVTLKVVHA